MTGWTDWRDAPPAEYGVVGDPIGHSLSPRMHRAAFRELGWTYAYRAIRVPAAEFASALDWLTRLGYRGLNVTQPLKEAAFAWADEIDEESRRYGALNTLCLARRRGTNTDAPGFLDVLKMQRCPPPARVLVLGAGGTASALVTALSATGYDIAIWNRTAAKGAALAKRVGAHVVDRPEATGFDLIVNGTSAGLFGQTPPIDWSGAEPDMLAIDVAYGEERTPFVAAAQRHGLRAIDGRALLAVQGALAFEWWHQVAPPFEAMAAAVG